MEETQALGLDSITLLKDDIPENSCNIIGSVSTNNDCGESHLGFFPKVGMTFETVDELQKFYKQHAIRSGFGVRIKTSKKDDHNELCYVKLVCSREGNHVSNIPPKKKTIPTQRKACPARVTTVKEEGEWLMRSAVEEHNHHLSPHKSKLVCGNRKINMQAKRVIDINDQAEVRLNKSFRSLVFDAGGYENLDFMERDVRNYIGQQRRALVKDGDGQTLFNHFSRMKGIK
ncbi:protein FAR-RED IMPAIRED RESPONSE 1-like [Vigna unguiculata]|uniref:protein FAR-RED IMPAIRED RESPONSE 1-like n=1 Tax=Vigna unguiculata TaxID=3917 RepID=UPI001016C749|nr:protein FAR-RED IMPAIRED RESPONSE 1-like [Vigna unguiculata]